MAENTVLIVKAGKVDKQYFSDLWRYRELLFYLAWRDILVRYKQTIIGIAWSVLRPLLTMIVFAFVFGRIAKLPSEANVPYPIMVFAGLLPWQFFATAFVESANSLVANRNMITKVYFPRMILPFSSVTVCFVDLLISMLILSGLMLYYHFIPTWRLFLLPFFALSVFFISVGPGLIVAALNVKYRDFRYVMPFVIQMGLYVSPVGYSSSAVPEKFQFLYSLNPMVGVINGFRWCIIGSTQETMGQQSLITGISALIFVIVGIIYFRSTEKAFADVI